MDEYSCNLHRENRIALLKANLFFSFTCFNQTANFFQEFVPNYKRSYEYTFSFVSICTALYISRATWICSCESLLVNVRFLVLIKKPPFSDLEKLVKSLRVENLSVCFSIVVGYRGWNYFTNIFMQKTDLKKLFLHTMKCSVSKGLASFSQFFNRHFMNLFLAFYILSPVAGRIILQGFPAAKTSEGIFLVTTLPAPMTVLSPIFTPGQITTLPPSHTSFPIVIGLAYSTPLALSS